MRRDGEAQHDQQMMQDFAMRSGSHGHEPVEGTQSYSQGNMTGS